MVTEIAILMLLLVPSLEKRDQGAGEFVGKEAPSLVAYTRPPSLRLPRKSHVEVAGYFRHRLDTAIENFLRPLPERCPGLLGMLRRPAESPVAWKGVFPGQYLSSAQLVWRVTQDAGLKTTIDRYVQDLLATQRENGYLGPFPSGNLKNYVDLWGHYSLLYGLLLYYRDTGYSPALKACEKIGDMVVETFGPGKASFPIASGANESISHALALLYRETGRSRYLDMTRYLAESVWPRPGSVDYLNVGKKHRGIRDFPQDRWEGVHNLSTLAEMYWLTGEEDYRRATLHIWEELRRYNRHSTGGFSADERIRGPLYVPPNFVIETCCTVAWITVSTDLLKLTGDSRIADEIEWSTFNSALGSIPDGPGVPTYGNPPDGHRNFNNELPGQDEYHKPPVLNCCTTNALRALGQVSVWGLMEKGDGLALNYYGPSTLSAFLPSGPRVMLTQTTDYPARGKVRIGVGLKDRCRFTLCLRIPRWSRKTRVEVNGEAVEHPVPGTYLEITREWRPGDMIQLELDLRPRLWAGAEIRAGQVAIYRGPLLYACDDRYFGGPLASLPVLDAVQLEWTTREPAGTEKPWSLWEIRTPGGKPFPVVDFASAGQTGGNYRSWFSAVNLPPSPFNLESPPDGETGSQLRWGGQPRSDALDRSVDVRPRCLQIRAD